MSASKNPRRDRVEIGVALATMACGMLVLAGTGAIPLGAGYDRIGPRVFPYVVAVGLLVSGAVFARGALVARPRPPEREAPGAAGTRAVVTLVLALGASVVLLERAGFVLTATLLFWLVARAFESRRPWRDALVGASLSILVYVAATSGLGLVLPRGPF